MPNTQDERDAAWHLDKKVPIALIIAIGLQTIGAVWWAATFSATTDQRIGAVERNQTTTAGQGDRLTRVEVKLETAIEGISEIKGILREDRRPSGQPSSR